METVMQADDLYQKVTSQIIAELEKGAVPWVKP
jgi:antirestriction protein ArdC